jgi:NAD(P) transhydrogenase
MTAAWDLVVIGSGPAGHKAAIQGSKAGRRVLVVEREPAVGGACVHHGTIPSKTLRETALALSAFRRRSGEVVDVRLPSDLQLASLLTRLEQVVRAHERYLDEQLARNGVDRWHGRARFLSPWDVAVEAPDGSRRTARGEVIVIAVGSRPRNPPGIPVDHEHVFDSDSLLSMTYLPQSLAVLGAGVIASEYASIFAALGVKVVMIDRGERPVSLLDPELTGGFVKAFEASGGSFLPHRRVTGVEWDGVSSVVTTLDSGEEIRTEKVLVALGRVANLDGLAVEAAGLAPTSRGLLEVDANCRTRVPHIYAAGDVIGPPSLAATAMEQGRRAVRHALGLGGGAPAEMVPLGVYTIPEMASVGLSEAEAVARHGGATVGRASFSEIARGQIAANPEGLLKLVADADGRRVEGVQIVGEGAVELVHVGQLALLAAWPVDAFVDNIFNFPTLAEAYRVAALDVVKRRPA